MKTTPAVRYTSGNHYESNMCEKTGRGKREVIPHYSLISAVIGTLAQAAGSMGSHYSAACRDYRSCLETQSSYKHLKQCKVLDTRNQHWCSYSMRELHGTKLSKKQNLYFKYFSRSWTHKPSKFYSLSEHSASKLSSAIFSPKNSLFWKDYGFIILEDCQIWA